MSLGEDEETLGEARERFERNEAGRRKLKGELKSTHLPNIVDCRGQVTGGSWEHINRYLVRF